MNLNFYGTILLYKDGLAICEDDFGDLWYTELPEGFGDPGTVIEIEALTQLSELPEKEQEAIRNEIAEMPESYKEMLRDGMKEV